MSEPMVQVPCPTCAGAGQVPFAQKYPQKARLCQLLYAMPPLSASDLWRNADSRACIGVTGWNQRLEELRALGFVTREKVGREWRYSLTEAGQVVARQGGR